MSIDRLSQKWHAYTLHLEAAREQHERYNKRLERIYDRATQVGGLALAIASSFECTDLDTEEGMTISVSGLIPLGPLKVHDDIVDKHAFANVHVRHQPEFEVPHPITYIAVHLLGGTSEGENLFTFGRSEWRIAEAPNESALDTVAADIDMVMDRLGFDQLGDR